MEDDKSAMMIFDDARMIVKDDRWEGSVRDVGFGRYRLLPKSSYTPRCHHTLKMGRPGFSPRKPNFEPQVPTVVVHVKENTEADWQRSSLPNQHNGTRSRAQ